jgi:hypothetical protein
MARAAHDIVNKGVQARIEIGDSKNVFSINKLYRIAAQAHVLRARNRLGV